METLRRVFIAGALFVAPLSAPTGPEVRAPVVVPGYARREEDGEPEQAARETDVTDDAVSAVGGAVLFATLTDSRTYNVNNRSILTQMPKRIDPTRIGSSYRYQAPIRQPGGKVSRRPPISK